MFDPSNLFPVLMILALFGGFLVAWITSLVIDFKNTSSMEELRKKHVLLFGTVVKGEGNEEVGNRQRVRRLECLPVLLPPTFSVYAV